MLLEISKNIATPVLDPPKVHIFWRIQHGDIFDEQCSLNRNNKHSMPS